MDMDTHDDHREARTGGDGATSRPLAPAGPRTALERVLAAAEREGVEVVVEEADGGSGMIIIRAPKPS